MEIHGRVKEVIQAISMNHCIFGNFMFLITMESCLF